MSIKVLLQEFHKAQEELQARLRVDGKRLLEESFKELFQENEGLRAFAFVGYTPSFNDGEECYHTDEVYIGEYCNLKQYNTRYGGYNNYWGNDWEDKEDLYELFISNEDFDYSDTSEDAVQPVMINKDCKDFKKAYEDVFSFRDAVEMVYGTDYIVTVKLEDDGSVTVHQQDYNCGY